MTRYPHVKALLLLARACRWASEALGAAGYWCAGTALRPGYWHDKADQTVPRL